MRTATAALFVTLAFATACTCASDAPPDAPAVKKTAKKIENPAVAERRAKQLDRLRSGKKSGAKGGKRSNSGDGPNALATVASDFQLTPGRAGKIRYAQTYDPAKLAELYEGYTIEEAAVDGGRRMVISAAGTTELEVYAESVGGPISEVHVLSDDYVTSNGSRPGLMLGRVRRASHEVGCQLGTGVIKGKVICTSKKQPALSVVVGAEEGPLDTLPADHMIDGWRIQRIIWRPVEPSKE
ncbi:MAG: DUF1131 family protein [Myxococcota bacterium]